MPFHNDEVCGMVTISEIKNRQSFYSPVPLTKVHLDVKVVNFTAQVEITQEFVNKERNPIECIYFIPVEEEAAVVDFTAELEGRKVKTKIKEKGAAREEYSHAVNNRQTAFLLEETKADIFEIKIGQLAPGAGCKIHITYLSELPVEDGKTKLTIPTTVAPRYVPLSDGSPEAKKIASIQHDFNSPVKMEMSLQVLMQTEILSIKSPSHSLTVPSKKKQQEYFEDMVQFSGTNTDMDRDMIIYIDTEDPKKPKVCVERNEEGSCVAMLSFVPDFKLKDQQVEAVFLVDCSGSMSGQSMRLAKEALQVFLHSLPTTSFFNIILFGSTFEYLFSKSKRYDDDTLKDAKESSDGISANLGGTEIYKPLEHIFNQPLMAGLARQVFVLTDGQVSNSLACIELVRKNNSKNRVFTLGIGSSADRHLVKGMARAGMGTSAFTTQGEPITAKVINQLKNALQPCISDVSVRWGKTNPFEGGGEVTEIVETKKTLFGFGKTIKQIANTFSINSQVPSKIPPIYDGSRLIAYKLIDNKLEDGAEITVKAKTPEVDLKLSLPISKDNFIEGNSVHQLCARKMIQEMEEIHTKENPEDSKRLITGLGLKYNLASKYTSFVGVDEKQGKSEEYMMTRHIKNQLPSNNGYGGTRSASYAAVDSAPRSRGYMAPPGAAPPGASRSLGSCAMSSQDYGCMTDSMEESLLGGGWGGMDHVLKSMPTKKSKNIVAATGSSYSSDVLRLTMCQAANGSFLPQDSVTNILGVKLEKVLDAGKLIKQEGSFLTAWMTLVVIAFLTEKCEDEKDVWELVVEKAKKWLQNGGFCADTAFEQKATEFILKLDSSAGITTTRTCPSGHSMFLVTERDGSVWHCDSQSRCVGGCNRDGEHHLQSVWRCDQDKRVRRGGVCDFDICGECIMQSV